MKRLWRRVPRRIRELWWDLYEGIRSLIYWFPVIWRDRNWDHRFLLIVLRHKLAAIGSMYWFQEPSEDGDEDEILMDIKIAYDALTRLINDVHETEFYRRHEQKWGQPRFKLNDKGMMELDNPSVVTEQEHQEYREDLLDGWVRVHKQQEADLACVFSILEENLTSWTV